MQCGGATACVRYRPVTTCTYQQVQVMRPTVRFVPETCYVQRTRTKFNPVQETVTVPVKKVNRVPCGTVNQCVTDYQMQSYDVTVCKMVRETDHGNGDRVRDDDDSALVDGDRSGGEVPAGHGHGHAADVCVRSLPGARHGHDHSGSARRPGRRLRQSAPASSQSGASPQGGL